MNQEHLPLVTIICTSYNHENFISECLDGFVMQQTNFLFEIIVHDDASKDNTQQIIKEYELKYPHLFNNIYQIENQFSKKQLNIWTEITFPMAKGKYIALCEGDDYWTDPLKLQKQIDFLEANSDYGLVHTDFVKFLDKANNFCVNKKNINFSFNSLLFGNSFIATLTVCFRKDIYLGYLEEIFPHSKEWLMGDLPLWLYISQNYKINYIDEVTSVYRVLEESASNTLNIEKKLSFEKSINEIRLFFLEKYIPKNLNSKRKLESIYLYRKIITNHLLKGSKNSFVKLLFEFYKVNRDFKLFIGSFKQIYHRFFN